MQYHTSAAAAPAERQPRAPVLLWAGCGAVFALGVWMVAAAAPAVAGHHVRVAPKIDATIGATTARSWAVGNIQPSRAAGATAMAAGKAAPPPPVTTALQPAGVAAAIGPWLYIAALVVSIAAAAISIWRSFQPAQAPALPAPASYYQAPEWDDEEAASKKPSNRMDEIALAVKQDLANRKNLTPKEVILELQRGNARFWSGTPLRPEIDVMERRALIIGQAPSVAILSCADSRVPVELLFDQGLGSMFVVRVAGNILDATAMGSIEFSVKYLGVKAVLVMGHEACGAVKGAMTMSPEVISQQPIYLQTVLGNIKNSLDVDKLNKIRDSRAQDREAVVANTSSQVKKLLQNPLIKGRVNEGSLLVAGAFYEITSGIVDFFTLDKNGLVTDI